MAASDSRPRAPLQRIHQNVTGAYRRVTFADRCPRAAMAPNHHLAFTPEESVGDAIGILNGIDTSLHMITTEFARISSAISAPILLAETLDLQAYVDTGASNSADQAIPARQPSPASPAVLCTGRSIRQNIPRSEGGLLRQSRGSINSVPVEQPSNDSPVRNR